MISRYLFSLILLLNSRNILCFSTHALQDSKSQLFEIPISIHICICIYVIDPMNNHVLFLVQSRKKNQLYFSVGFSLFLGFTLRKIIRKCILLIIMAQLYKVMAPVWKIISRPEKSSKNVNCSDDINDQSVHDKQYNKKFDNEVESRREKKHFLVNYFYKPGQSNSKLV